MFQEDTLNTGHLMREEKEKEEKVPLVHRKQQQRQRQQEQDHLVDDLLLPMRRVDHHNECCDDPLIALAADVLVHPWHLEHWYYSDGVIYERPSSPQTRRRQRQSLRWHSQWQPSFYRGIFASRILLVLIVLSSLLLQQHGAQATSSNSKSPLDNINVNVNVPSTTTARTASASTGTGTSNPILPTTEETCKDELSAGTNKPEKKKIKTTKDISVSPVKTTTTKSTPTTLSGSQSNFIRRVQREWKDAVQMGIAYDWTKGKPIKRTKKNPIDDSEQQPRNNQYMCLGPLSKHNLFQWHFSFQGMEGSPYESGIYHGRVLLPHNYPMAPPRVQVWTPSGRFIPRADICLSASSFHPETWNPAAYNLRTIIESLRLHMLTHAMEVGGIHRSITEQRKLAKESRHWKQPVITSKKRREGILINHETLIEQKVFSALEEKEETTTTESMSPNEDDDFNNVNTTINSAGDDSSSSIQSVAKKKGKKKKKKPAIDSMESTRSASASPPESAHVQQAYDSNDDASVIHDDAAAAVWDDQQTSMVQRKAKHKSKKNKKANVNNVQQLHVRKKEEMNGVFARLVILSKNRPLRIGLMLAFLYLIIFEGRYNL